MLFRLQAGILFTTLTHTHTSTHMQMHTHTPTQAHSHTNVQQINILCSGVKNQFY